MLDLEILATILQLDRLCGYMSFSSFSSGPGIWHRFWHFQDSMPLTEVRAGSEHRLRSIALRALSKTSPMAISHHPVRIYSERRLIQWQNLDRPLRVDPQKHIMPLLRPAKYPDTLVSTESFRTETKSARKLKKEIEMRQEEHSKRSTS